MAISVFKSQIHISEGHARHIWRPPLSKAWQRRLHQLCLRSVRIILKPCLRLRAYLLTDQVGKSNIQMIGCIIIDPHPIPALPAGNRAFVFYRHELSLRSIGLSHHRSDHLVQNLRSRRPELAWPWLAAGRPDLRRCMRRFIFAALDKIPDTFFPCRVIAMLDPL